MNQGDRLSHPGQSTPALSFSALGLPDLVQYWAIPDLETHPPVDDDRNYHIEPLKGFADSGTTVGIVPLVPSAPAATRLAKLHELLDYSCGSAQWINDASVCVGLRSKLNRRRSRSRPLRLTRFRLTITPSRRRQLPAFDRDSDISSRKPSCGSRTTRA